MLKKVLKIPQLIFKDIISFSFKFTDLTTVFISQEHIKRNKNVSDPQTSKIIFK